MNMQALGNRMKKYETASAISLCDNMPVIIRVDGKAFHTLTRQCKKPFDGDFNAVMNKVALYLCSQVMNVRLAYLQSDEISLLLFKRRPESEAWFDNNLQKLVSVCASMCSSEAHFTMQLSGWQFNKEHLPHILFDARAFVVPAEDVDNYFLWRQRDCERNSILGLAQQHYSQKQLNGKNKEALHEMLHQKGVNWNDLPTSDKRGRCAVKEGYLAMPISEKCKEALRSRWIIDNEIPIFSQTREYITKHLIFDDVLDEPESTET